MKSMLMRIGLVSLGSFLLFSQPVLSLATADSVDGTGHIRFEGEKIVGPVDPENPATPVNPGETPSTTGALRLDFVPQLNFHANKITDKDKSYPVNAQLFLDETPARGNYIQVTDERGTNSGWSLQLRQEMQFENTETANRQLNGAVLSFDKSWTNSTQPSDLAPTVSKEVIRLDNIGAAYNLAEAGKGKGSGTWLISFGASSTNPQGLATTLVPKVDDKGEAVLDAAYNNQQVYENSAVTLFIPGATQIDPVAYTTVLTWILAELP